MTLQGTVALVTGSSSGIGAATATRLAAEGAAVAIVARRRDRLDELSSTIRNAGGSALVVEADLTVQRQAVDAVGRTVSELGRLDTVVNNAGVMLLGPALESPTDEWERMLALNVQGTLYVTHAALPHLVRAAEDSPRRVADLVFISSTAGRVVRPGGNVYSLTKFGIGAFAESLRQELISGACASAWSSPEWSTPSSSRTCERSASCGAEPGELDRGDAARGHRRRDLLHRHARSPRGDQRDARPRRRADLVERHLPDGSRRWGERLMRVACLER